MSAGPLPFPRHRSRLWPRLACLAAAALACACTRRPRTEPDTLVVALAASPNTLDPRYATDAAGSRISGLLFSSLVRVGPDLELVGDLATDWEYKDKTYVFRLRPGLTFSDGQKVTAEDIEFSFAQFLDPKSPFASSLDAIESVRVRYDDQERTARLRLREYSATLLSELGSIKILPKKTVLAAGDDFGKILTGSGSFAFERQDSAEIALRARADHPFAPPRSKRLVFKIIRDDNTRFLKTYKGEIDIVQSELPPFKIASLEKKGGFKIHKYPGLAMTYLLLNLEDPDLRRLEVRQALARAINREDIIRFKLEGLAVPATSVLTPINPFFNADLRNLPFSVEEARRALEKAGVTRELTLKTSNTQTAVENGRVLAYQLGQAGLKVRLQSFEWGTFYGDVKKGNFQMATMRWVGTNDPDIYRSALHSKEVPPGRNRGRYGNVKLDALLEKGVKIEDRDERIRHYREVQRIVHEDLPYIPLWYDTEVAVAHERVHGYEPPKNGDFSALVKAYKE